VAGLVALVVAGCTSHAGAAAQVDNQTISTATLGGIVDRGWAAYSAFVAANPAFVAQQEANGQAPLTRDALQRQWLGTLVAVQLAEVEVRKLGLSVSDQDIDAYYQQVAVSQVGSVPNYDRAIAQVGVAPQDVRQIVRLDALQSKIEDKVAPDLIGTDSEARSAYDTLVASFGTLPLTYAQMRPLLERTAQSVIDQRQAKLQPLLTQASKQVGVSVSPRFGVWSPDDVAVLAQSGSIATVPTPIPQLNLSS
jgi:hypothetical protein